MPREMEIVDCQVEKNPDILVNNQGNIDVQCLCLYHSFPSSA